jgi:hypothetical protein
LHLVVRACIIENYLLHLQPFGVRRPNVKRYDSHIKHLARVKTLRAAMSRL